MKSGRSDFVVGGNLCCDGYSGRRFKWIWWGSDVRTKGVETRGNPDLYTLMVLWLGLFGALHDIQIRTR